MQKTLRLDVPASQFFCLSIVTCALDWWQYCASKLRKYTDLFYLGIRSLERVAGMSRIWRTPQGALKGMRPKNPRLYLKKGFLIFSVCSDSKQQLFSPNRVVVARGRLVDNLRGWVYQPQRCLPLYSSVDI